MAEFNPEMRFGNIPDWTNAPGRLIDQSGLGELFANVTKTVAETAGDFLDKRASNDITSSMNGLWDEATTKESADKAGIPLEVARGMKKIDLFQKAIEKGGVSQTNALAQMEAEMKRLIAKYPQRTDEIQQAYAKATGNTPANDLYKEIAAEYNAQTKADRAAKKDVQQQFNTWAPWMDKGDPEKFFGATESERYGMVIKAAARKNQNEKIDVMKNQLALQGEFRKEDAANNAPLFIQDIDNNISMLFRGDMNKVIDMFKKAKEDGNISPEERQQLTAVVEDAKLRLGQSFDERLTKPFGPPGKQRSWREIFANDPSIISTQKERIDGYIGMLDGLLTNKSGTGILELNATTMKVQQEHAQSKFAQSGLGQKAIQIKTITDMFGDAGKKWMEENFGTIMDSTGTDGSSTLATEIANQLKLASMTPGATLSSLYENNKDIAPGEKPAFNAGARNTVETHLKTIQNLETDPRIWEQSAAFLFAPENANFFAALSTRENQYGVSQQELAFQAFTDPKVAAAFKARGKEKQYADAVMAWSQPVLGSLPEDIRGRAGIFLGSGNIGNKAGTASFNPETMQVEFRIDPAKVKDPIALGKWMNGREEVPPDRLVAAVGINPSQMYDLRATAKSIQRINLIVKAQVGAMKAQGMSNDQILQYLQTQLGDLAPGKEDPFIDQIIPMIGQHIKENLDGTANKRAFAERDKALYGEDFGVNPSGVGNTQLSVLEGGSATSTVGTTPDTGDDTANSILAFIHDAEGADYNTVFGGGKVDAASMTVADVLARTENAGSSAFGAVQVMKDTLKGLVRNGVVTPDQVMDQATQDKIGMALLKEAGYDDWKAGKISDGAFADKLAGIWASLPLKGGKSKYEGVGPNKATVKRADVLALLEDLR